MSYEHCYDCCPDTEVYWPCECRSVYELTGLTRQRDIARIRFTALGVIYATRDETQYELWSKHPSFSLIRAQMLDKLEEARAHKLQAECRLREAMRGI